MSKAAIARAAWDLSSGAQPSGVVLTADLTESSGDCKAALWAQLASNPERKVKKAEEASPAVTGKALVELRTLVEYQEIQKESGSKQPWDLLGRTEVWVMRHPSGKELVYIAANASSGCDGFQGNLSAIFEVHDERFVLAGKPGPVPPEAPSSVIDIGGKIEILFTERLLRGETRYDQNDLLSIPFLDCGC